MPQIQEYLPEVGAQGPVGGVSPNVEMAGATGRSLERLGDRASEVGSFVHQKNVQAETADIYSSFAEKRAEWGAKLAQQVQDGSLDTEKFKDDYEDDVDSMGDDISTTEGRNFFERQSARLKGSLLKTASIGAATIARNDAMDSWKTGVNASSAALMQDPLQFEDVHSAGIEAVDSLVKNSGLPEKFRGKLLEDMGQQYSKAAVRGWANLDPDKAKQMLDQGGFDQYLTGDQKHEMYGEVDRYANAKVIEGTRADKALEDARKKGAEAWGQQNLEALSNNALSTKTVLNAVHDGTLNWETGERWMNMIKEGAKQEIKTDPRVKNQLIQRMVNPDSQNPIDSVEQLMPYVGKGISIADFNSMNSLFNKTPEQQSIHQGEKALFDSMRKTIRFKNPMTQQYDLLGEQKLARAMSDYTQAKSTVKAQGGQLGDLVNPSSPFYFGSRIGDYQTSMQDQMGHVSQERSDKALGLKPAPNENPSGKVAPGARKQGESAADFLKRRGLGSG